MFSAEPKVTIEKLLYNIQMLANESILLDQTNTILATLPQQDKNMALALAVYKGHSQLVEFLLTSGADPNTRIPIPG